jgi:hypothetical protein
MKKLVPALHLRRTTLRWLMATGIGLLTPLSAQAFSRDIKHERSPLSTSIQNILSSSGESVRLGKHYLHEHPAEAELAFLSHCVRGIGSQAMLQECIQQEFDAGAVVTVDGWVLSRTEARLYALSTLAACQACITTIIHK